MKWTVFLSTVLFIFFLKLPGNPAQEHVDVDYYPEITYFPPFDLVSVGDVVQDNDFKIPCKAKGKRPLNIEWLTDDEDGSVKFIVDTDGSLVGRKVKSSRITPYFQCAVSNDYGKVLSAKRQIDVTAITNPFQAGPTTKASKLYFSFGHPLIIPCPPHETHLGANYSWGAFRKDEFYPLKDSKHYGITTGGSLVFSFIKASDIKRTLFCKVSVGSTYFISKGYGFSAAKSRTQSGSEFAVPPSLAEKPQAYEMAVRGSTKTMRCIPTGNPVPDIIWWKDGTIIYSGKNDMELQSYNRILVIRNIDKDLHTGKYQCGYGGHVSTRKVLATTHLHVTGPPVIMRHPLKALTLETKQDFTLRCSAKQMFSSSPDDLVYEWYKDGEKLDKSRNRTTINKNTFTVKNTQAADSGVYQCVATDSQGMDTAATRVHIKVKMCSAIPPPSNSKFTEGSCHMHSWFVAGSRCTVLCDRGFFGKGHRNYRKCMDDGGWSVMQYTCEDSEPPYIRKGYGCPNDIVIATQRSNDTGIQVTWKPPAAEDNSGRLVTNIEPQEIMGNSHWFPVGENLVKYRFIDLSGKEVSCQFTVNVFTRTQIITKAPSLNYILKGKPLTLDCVAISYPVKPIYIWKRSKFTDIKNVVDIVADSNIQLMGGGERLVITHVTDDDSGKYQCEAVNTYYNGPGVKDVAVVSVEVIKAVEWSPWQRWTMCSAKKCGKGLQTRKRTCLKKHTRRVAMGCTGEDNQSRDCEVRCTTPPQKPLGVKAKDKDFNKKSGMIKLSKINVGVREKTKIIEHVVGKYEVEARGWLKEHFPWLNDWLETTGGRLGFAISLVGVGIAIVLVSWICGRFFFSRKKKVHFADGDSAMHIKDNENKVKREERNKDNETSPIYENIQTTPIYDTLLDDHNTYAENNYENTPIGGHYQNTGYSDEHYYQYDQGGYEDEELVYEDMATEPQ